MKGMNHKKVLAALVAIGALVLAASAFGATGETMSIKLPRGYLQINPVTCKFVHPEVDVQTGPSWLNLKVYVLQEDARHDVRMNCVANRKPPRAQLLYKTAYATGTGLRVTATCPAGYFVTGGGSHFETTGSYEEGNDAWTVVRDSQSPRVLDVTAICIRFGS